MSLNGKKVCIKLKPINKLENAEKAKREELGNFGDEMPFLKRRCWWRDESRWEEHIYSWNANGWKITVQLSTEPLEVNPTSHMKSSSSYKMFCVMETHKNPIHFWVFPFYFLIFPNSLSWGNGDVGVCGVLGYPQLYYLGTEPSLFQRVHVGDLPSFMNLLPTVMMLIF